MTASRGCVVRVALEPHRPGRRPRSPARARRTEARIASRSDSSARRPSPRAGRGRRRSAAPSERASARRGTRPEHAELGELVLQGDRRAHRRLGVVGHHDHRVLGEELRRAPPAGVHHARELQVGLRRSTGPGRRGRACASTSRCRAATAAGSRTGRARRGRPTRSRSGGRARPACPAPSGSRCGARRRCRRRTARAGPSPGGASAREATRVSAVSRWGSWRWRPRYIR